MLLSDHLKKNKIEHLRVIYGATNKNAKIYSEKEEKFCNTRTEHLGIQG